MVRVTIKLKKFMMSLLHMASPYKENFLGFTPVKYNGEENTGMPVYKTPTVTMMHHRRLGLGGPPLASR